MQYVDNNSDSIPSQDGREENEMPPPKRRRTGNNANSVSRELGLMRDGIGSTSASFVGSASGIHFIRSVYNAMGTSTIETTSPAVNLVPGEDDRLTSETSTGTRKSIWLDHEVDFSTSSTKPTFDNFTEWTASYFDAWHPVFPLLHAPSILELLETATQTDFTNLYSFDLVILKSIHSLSLADRRQTHAPLSRPVPKDYLFLTFDEALESVQAALTRPATIKGLQAVTCVQLFLVSMLRLNAAARLGGLIVQMAYQLGLHRCPLRFKGFSSEECQLRKRLFWSVYCIERYLCQALGHPLVIHDEDVDVCFVNKELHITSSKGHTGDSDVITSDKQTSSEAFDHRLQLLTFLTQHARLRGAIIELRNKNVEVRDRNPDAAILINAKLTQWWNDVEDYLDQQPGDDTNVSKLHQAILESLRHESIIMLNRPLLALRKDAANYSAAFHTCISAAKSILTTLTSLLQPTVSEPNGSQFVPMMWPSFTWATWMSAYIIFYTSAEGKIDMKVANRNIDKSMKILKRLEERGSVWPQACAVAIEDLNSNLRRQQQKDHASGHLPGGLTTDSLTHDNRQDLPVRDVRATYSPTLPHSTTRQILSHNVLNNGPRRTQDLSQKQTEVATTSVASSETEQSRALQFGNPQQSSLGVIPDSRLISQNNFALNFDDDASWQNLSFLTKAMPQMSPAGGDPLLGFDIPFWMGQDNYIAWTNEST